MNNPIDKWMNDFDMVIRTEAYEALQELFASSRCLHQIQEPVTDIWPCVNIDVDESGKITNAKLYSPGLPAGNHDVYPVRVPYMDEHTEAWRACVDELEKAVPGFMSLGNMNGIECAVAAIRGLAERAKHQEPAAAEQAAWHAGLDEGRAQAVPAAVAVAVPDPASTKRMNDLYVALEVCSAELFAQCAHQGRAMKYVEQARKALAAEQCARAALVATPAQSMVLPEPVAWLAHYEDREGNSKYYTSTHKDLAQENDTNGEPQSLFTEQQVRALLATATGLPAQAVAYIDSEVLTSFLSSSNYRPEDGWDCHIRHQENKRDTDVPLYAAPQTQVVARDAESDYQRGYRHGYNRRDAEVQGALL